MQLYQIAYTVDFGESVMLEVSTMPRFPGRLRAVLTIPHPPESEEAKLPKPQATYSYSRREDGSLAFEMYTGDDTITEYLERCKDILPLP